MGAGATALQAACLPVCLKVHLQSTNMLGADGLPASAAGACRRGSDAGSPPAEGSDERLRQVLHRSGLESDAEAGGDSESGDDVDEDLDAMASGLQTRVCTSQCWCSFSRSFCFCKM